MWSADAWNTTWRLEIVLLWLCLHVSGCFRLPDCVARCLRIQTKKVSESFAQDWIWNLHQMSTSEPLVYIWNCYLHVYGSITNADPFTFNCYCFQVPDCGHHLISRNVRHCLMILKKLQRTGENLSLLKLRKPVRCPVTENRKLLCEQVGRSDTYLHLPHIVGKYCQVRDRVWNWETVAPLPVYLLAVIYFMHWYTTVQRFASFLKSSRRFLFSCGS